MSLKMRPAVRSKDEARKRHLVAFDLPSFAPTPRISRDKHYTALPFVAAIQSASTAASTISFEVA